MHRRYEQTPLSVFPEPCVDKFSNCQGTSSGVGTVTPDLELCALSRREHHDLHDAARVDLDVVSSDPHGRVERLDGVDECHRGPRVKTQPVLHGDSDGDMVADAWLSRCRPAEAEARRSRTRLIKDKADRALADVPIAVGFGQQRPDGRLVLG